MQPRDHGPSSSRSKQQENPRPPHSHPGPHTLSSKRSVEDYFSSSRFLSTAPGPSSKRPLQKSKTLGASAARRSPTQQKSAGHFQRAGKNLEYNARHSTNDTFLWAKGELIGQGSHGKVYLGFNATTGELMAVKQVEVPSTADDRRKAEIVDFVKTLRSERETLRDLAHPNIVEYLGFEENPQNVNIFLQYVSGGTIGRCLKEYGPFKEEVTKSFTHQILEGIFYLHSKGIIHRDLKSDNILVDPAGVCKISDFGISKKLELDRAYSAFKGTSYWMAPEMILAGPEVGYNSKVDIWSVGCIVFEMWTAKRPWHTEINVWQVIQKLTRKEAPFLPDGCYLSILAEHFRKECFAPDPAQRPAAEFLLSHPYLLLPPGWTFPGILEMGYRSANGAVSTSDFEEDLGLSSLYPNSTATSSSEPTVSAPQSNPPRAISPRLVTIVPPLPRKLPNPRSPALLGDLSLSATSDSLARQNQSRLTAETGAQRKLDIHDPKMIPDLTRPKKRQLPKPPISEPFVYNPPNLPPLNGDTPYSNSLAPLPKFASSPPPGRKPRKENKISLRGQEFSSTLSLPTMPRRMGPANLKDAMAYTSSIAGSAYRSDDDGRTLSTSYSGWAKPPPHSATSSRRRPSLPQTPSERNRPVSPPIIPQRQSAAFSGVTRPDDRQVLGHMKDYFPDHDLDEPLVSSPMDPVFTSNQESEADFNTIQTRQFTKKSIKSIAEEQMNRDLGAPKKRPQTRLWDSNIEEIKAQRKSWI